MHIKFNEEHIQAISNHAEKTYPEECCGLLLGTIEGEAKTVIEVWPTANMWDKENPQNISDKNILTKRQRYVLDPQMMLKAQREGRDRGLNIIGFYHSHPDHPAVPSECDREYAWPEYSYIIIAVKTGKTTDILSWNLNENYQFQPEQILNTPPH